LFRINLAWDRVQLTVFFVQETALSLLYIFQARKYLRNSSLLSKPYTVEPTPGEETAPARATPETHQVLLHLVLANCLVIALDISLLGVQYADLFYLQGAFKPCVYGVKLKVEFAILNRLLELVRRRGRGGMGTLFSDGSGSGGGIGLSLSAPPPGGEPYSTPRAGQSQPQILVSRSVEVVSKWDDENRAATGRHEEISLGQLGRRLATDPSRSRSHESQDPILAEEGRGRGNISD
jgi:hypothetical protein